MMDSPTLEEVLAEGEVPQTDGKPVFDAPWQARAFGLVVATTGEDSAFEWDLFQSRLVDAIDEEQAATGDGDAEEIYYRQWLAAFECLLEREGLLEYETIENRVSEFAAGDRTAAEFVEGGQDH